MGFKGDFCPWQELLRTAISDPCINPSESLLPLARVKIELRSQGLLRQSARMFE